MCPKNERESKLICFEEKYHSYILRYYLRIFGNKDTPIMRDAFSTRYCLNASISFFDISVAELSRKNKIILMNNVTAQHTIYLFCKKENHVLLTRKCYYQHLPKWIGIELWRDNPYHNITEINKRIEMTCFNYDI